MGITKAGGGGERSTHETVGESRLQLPKRLLRSSLALRDYGNPFQPWIHTQETYRKVAVFVSD